MINVNISELVYFLYQVLQRCVRLRLGPFSARTDVMAFEEPVSVRTLTLWSAHLPWSRHGHTTPRRHCAVIFPFLR